MTQKTFGVCNLSVIPVREAASDRSEQVTQLLFGETFEVIGQGERDWLRVRIDLDHYEGWVDSKQVTLLDELQIPAYRSARPLVAIDNYNPVEIGAGNMMLPFGSTLPCMKPGDFSIGGMPYRFFGKYIEAGNSASQGNAATYAQQFLNTPYLWGGRSVAGIDCSGLTQVVFKVLGFPLLRDAYQQAEQGTLVNFIEEVKSGDLAFFDNEEERIIHVGIILDHERIIHASGRVRIDKFDHHGIYNVDTKRYSHKLRIIKRMV